MARILVVEDDDAVAAYLRDMLETAGYEVDRAATSDGAAERILDTPYDLVMMDMLLQSCPGGNGNHLAVPPSMNGAVTTCALRHLGYDGPVVMMTGNLAVVDKRIEEAAGFAGRLLKPALPSAVLPEIARHLSSAGIPATEGKG